MAYGFEQNKYGSHQRRKDGGVLSTNASSVPRGPEASRYLFYELEAAEVVDIILTEEYGRKLFGADFSYNDIGKIKFRFINSQNGLDEDSLLWAKPIETNIKMYPLKHELVIIAAYVSNESVKLGGDPSVVEYYYSQKMNIWGSVNHNALPDVSMYKSLSSVSSRDYSDIESGNPNNSGMDDIIYGNVFIPDDTIKPLQPYEGDIIHEGRFGHSIRFGSNQDSGKPNIRIRNGQSTSVDDLSYMSPVDEDINSDGSSIWMTSDENVEASPASEAYQAMSELGIFPSKMNGNQITISSGRILFNSRDSEILAFSKNGIGLSTDGNFSCDSGREFVVGSPKISLGLGATEPIVLGNVLAQLLRDLIDAIPRLKYHYGELTGNGPLLPIKQRIDTILSGQNYTL